MAVNIFELFGTIGADDKPAKKAIDNVVSHAKNANHVMSDGLNKIGSTATSMGNALNKYITKPAIVATTALAGISLKKGWDRLTGIDDARAKLMGLGHDAETIEKIMTSALASVKGTAFGMDEAATTAANAVAAGVKEGEELTKYLKLTADAAAIAGTSMGEMGSIINKVQTGGRAMTENLEQLSDRGLPIYQWLAKEAGVAADAVKDMASDGAISSEMFLAAIEKNIGGAAAIMGENSFKSTIANIGASLGRVGANFLDAGGKGGGFFSTMKPLLADMNKNMGFLETKAADIGVKFGESFNKVIKVVSDLKAKFDELSPAAQSSLLKSTAGFAGFAVAAGPALKVIGGIATKLSPIAKVIETTNGAIGGLVASMSSGLGTMGSGLLSFGGLILQVLGPAAIIGALVVGLGAVQSTFGDQLDSFFQMAQEKGPNIIIGLTNGMMSKIPELMSQGTTLIINFLETITANLPAIIQGGGLVIFSLITGLADNIPKMIPVVMTLINTLLTNLISMAPHLIQAGLQLILSLAQGISDNLPTLIVRITNLIPQLITSLARILPMIISFGVKIVTTLAVGILKSIPHLIKAIPQIYQALKEGIASIDWKVLGQEIIDSMFAIFGELGSMLANVFSPVTEWLGKVGEDVSRKFDEMAQGVQNAWNGTKEFFSNMWEGVKSIFSDLGTWMSEAPGKAADDIKNKWNGIKEFFSNMWNSVKDATSQAWGYITDLFSPIVEEILRLFSPLIEWFSGLWEQIKTIAGSYWEIIKSVIMGPILFLIDLITGDFGQLKDDMIMIWTTISENAMLIWTTIKDIILGFAKAIFDTVVNWWEELKNAAIYTWQLTVEQAQLIWNTLKEWFFNIVGLIVNGVVSGWNNLKQGTIDIFNATIDWIKTTWDNLKNWFSTTIDNIVNGAVNGWNNLKQGTVDIFNALVDGAKQAWENLKQSVSDVVDGVKGIFDTLSNINLLDIGKAIIDGFIDGLTGAWEKGKEFISSIGDWIRKHKGPIEVDKKLLIPAGHAIMGGLHESLVDGFKDVQSYVSSMADDISTGFDPSVFQTDFAYSVYGNGNQSQNNQTQLVTTLDRLLRLLEEWKDNPVNLNIYNEADVEWLRTYVNRENKIDEIVYKF